ncbi:hypothetical protein CLOSTMETH_01471 [[Clostridium] methylpentosum DSM 5476]|uniref:Uncharacterized protein n=1 Tax=[Clostridium] methylpentosum DSM 5476 TaxID=537013 RepID=C0ECA1_9FIRM|nr:hypothetical protein CLOSTMETH_01471 [[Clostridium] methylpentosum DSM 5476]
MAANTLFNCIAHLSRPVQEQGTILYDYDYYSIPSDLLQFNPFKNRVNKF